MAETIGVVTTDIPANSRTPITVHVSDGLTVDVAQGDRVSLQDNEAGLKVGGLAFASSASKGDTVVSLGGFIGSLVPSGTSIVSLAVGAVVAGPGVAVSEDTETGADIVSLADDTVAAGTRTTVSEDTDTKVTTVNATRQTETVARTTAEASPDSTSGTYGTEVFLDLTPGGNVDVLTDIEALILTPSGVDTETVTVLITAVWAGQTVGAQTLALTTTDNTVQKLEPKDFAALLGDGSVATSLSIKAKSTIMSSLATVTLEVIGSESL